MSIIVCLSIIILDSLIIIEYNCTQSNTKGFYKMQEILRAIIHHFATHSISQEYLSDLLLDIETGALSEYQVAWAVKGYLRCSSYAKQLDSEDFEKFFDRVNGWLANETA